MMKYPIQILSAPSILGLRPTGVEYLADRLIKTNLAGKLETSNPVIYVPTKNDRYSFERDKITDCLNPVMMHDFSLVLCEQVFRQIDSKSFPLILGGDCSILIGIIPALKKHDVYGLIFLDAHADFYEPSKSPTGEVADMDLAIITGRGPDILTNIDGLKPYVEDRNVIHIGQRDAEETKRYGSRDIKDSAIACFDLEMIKIKGLDITMNAILNVIDELKVRGFWIHFDTDVMNDDENPAVDYRLPGGLLVKEVESILKRLSLTGKMIGMSVTIYNPKLDPHFKIAEKLSDCIAKGIKN